MSRQDKALCFGQEDLARIRHATIVQTIEHHQEISSTNSRALKLADDSQLELPLLVLADQQTAGRGRGGNDWWSAPGALTCSLVLEQHSIAADALWPRVSLTAGLAVCEALRDLVPGLNVGLKWPNDVYVQKRKICGILVEVPPQPSRNVVVGIGINVNNALASAPGSVAACSTSLVDEAGYTFDLTLVLIRVLEQFRAHLGTLATPDTQLQSRWQAFCMLTGRVVHVDAGVRRTQGTCRGIDRTGGLLVETAQGLEKCVTGVVTWFE